jgi:hypothetical protein
MYLIPLIMDLTSVFLSYSYNTIFHRQTMTMK